MTRTTIDKALATAVLADAERGRTVQQICATRDISLATTYRVLNGTRWPDAAPGQRPKRRRLASADIPQLLEAARDLLSSTTTVADDGCWLTSACDADGLIRLAGRHFRLARLSYLAFVGPLALGVRASRMCHHGGYGDVQGEERSHRRCWRPDHLGVQASQHVGRSTTSVAVEACPHGHEYTLTNTRFRATRAGGVTRACRACARERRRHQLQQAQVNVPNSIRVEHR